MFKWWYMGIVRAIVWCMILYNIAGMILHVIAST